MVELIDQCVTCDGEFASNHIRFPLEDRFECRPCHDSVDRVEYVAKTEHMATVTIQHEFPYPKQNTTVSSATPSVVGD